MYFTLTDTTNYSHCLYNQGSVPPFGQKDFTQLRNNCLSKGQTDNSATGVNHHIKGRHQEGLDQ